MSIRPIDFNGMIQRTDDIGHMKQQQEQKPLTDQQFIQSQVRQNEQQQLHQVVQSNEGNRMKNHADAREEGKNKYFQDSNKKKKSLSKPEEGRVIRKNQTGSFDLKI